MIRSLDTNLVSKVLNWDVFENKQKKILKKKWFLFFIFKSVKSPASGKENIWFPDSTDFENWRNSGPDVMSGRALSLIVIAKIISAPTSPDQWLKLRGAAGLILLAAPKILCSQSNICQVPKFLTPIYSRSLEGKKSTSILSMVRNQEKSQL